MKNRVNCRSRCAVALLLLLPCLAGCRPDGGATQTQPANVSPAQTPTPQVAVAAAEPVAALFRPVLAQLKSETGVAILLPAELPSPLAERKVYVEGFGRPDEYSITLTSTPQCGANACTIGYFEAKRGGKPSFERKVMLARGVEGYYQPLTCGGSCTPPTVEWLSDGVLYTIQLDVAGEERLNEEEEQKRLIRVADSAINAGPR